MECILCIECGKKNTRLCSECSEHYCSKCEPKLHNGEDYCSECKSGYENSDYEFD